jgi:hypothetical protein
VILAMSGVCGFSPEGGSRNLGICSSTKSGCRPNDGLSISSRGDSRVDPNLVALPSSRRGTKNLDADFHRHDAL